MSLPYLQPYFGLSNSLQTAQAAAGGAGGIGGWVELGRTTLGSAGDNIDVTGLANKRYLMFLGHGLCSSATNPLMVVGNGSFDSGSNYAERNTHSGSDITQVNQPKFNFGYAQTTSVPSLTVGYLSNLAAKEKLLLSHTVFENAAGAGNSPTRYEYAAKWTNTSNVIDQMRFWNAEAGSWDSGAELVVLGWDPADTHTSNFWEELASVELGSAGASLSSGTITAKKYLWVQVFFEHLGGSNPNTLWRFNSDSGNNYANRSSHDGGSEDVETGISHLDFYGQPNDSNGFINMFIINNTSNEKLVIGHTVLAGASGAGNSPSRDEHVAKWANTSNQITNITCTSTNGNNHGGKSFIKVWGSD